MGDRSGKISSGSSKGGGRPPASAGKAEGTGRRRQGGWSSHSDAEVENLRRDFTDVLVLPEDLMEAARQSWEGVAVIVRSLGRQVRAEWVAREMKTRGKLDYEVEAFPLAEGYRVLRFKSEEDREEALVGGPWVVAGQLLAVEPWVPDFVPGTDVVNTTVVWVRLPRLPLEYWDKASILQIAAAAGRPLAMDSFTEQLKKLEYAKVKVAIDASKPLKPGIQIRGSSRVFWQPFVYESISLFCYQCGRIGHSDEGCKFPLPEPLQETEELPDLMKNPASMVVESRDNLGEKPDNKGDEDASARLGRRLVFGPWLTTVRIQPPWTAAKGAPRARKMTESTPESSGPGSSSSRPGSPRNRPRRLQRRGVNLGPSEIAMSDQSHQTRKIQEVNDKGINAEKGRRSLRTSPKSQQPSVAAKISDLRDCDCWSKEASEKRDRTID